MEGSPIGFARSTSRPTSTVLRASRGVGRGVGAALYDAVEKLAAARGAPHLSVEASDTAREFFAHRGFHAQQRNSVSVGNEWLEQHDDEKEAPAGKRGRVMSKERLYLFDTTLRDGAQTNGVDFTLPDKSPSSPCSTSSASTMSRAAIRAPIRSTPGLFAETARAAATFTAFGMTRRAGRSASNDPGLAALLDAKADAICFVAKSWDYHVGLALGTTLEENLASIRDSVRAAKAKGREVLLDCEHFFDGYKANPAYALACAQAAHDAGARWVVLCDTNGGTLPHEVEAIVGEVVKVIPGDQVGIHAHNDTEQAVANSLAAVRAGARQIQGTLNGLGERCGNANLISIIPTLKLKPEFAERFEIGVVGRQAHDA